MGGLNGTIDCFESVLAMLQPKQGWTDVGMDQRICKGHAGQNACHANDKAKESGIDHIFSNRTRTPALENGRVEIFDKIPTHRPFLVDIRITKLQRTLKTTRQCTDFAALNEAMIQAKIDEARAQADPEQEAVGDTSTNTKFDESAIRRAIIN